MTNKRTRASVSYVLELNFYSSMKLAQSRLGRSKDNTNEDGRFFGVPKLCDNVEPRYASQLWLILK